MSTFLTFSSNVSCYTQQDILMNTEMIAVLCNAKMVFVYAVFFFILSFFPSFPLNFLVRLSAHVITEIKQNATLEL